MSAALRRWADDLLTWRIPDDILARAPEPPWTHPTAVFARRADARIQQAVGPTYVRSLEALPEAGSVLDVGAGVGAASLPLLGRAASLVAVDTSATMLDELARRVPKERVLRRVQGRWPDVSVTVPAADVVVCANVLYDTPALEPFVRALHDHSRRRVVIEITQRHPAARLNALWERFHGLRRPERPTWIDARDAIRSLGLAVQVDLAPLPPDPPASDFAEVVALTRRRLCLPVERDPDVAAALEDLGYDPGQPRTWQYPRDVCTMWWDT